MKKLHKVNLYHANTKSRRIVLAHTYNLSTQETEASGSLSVRGQYGLKELVLGQPPKLQRNSVSKNQKEKNNTKCINQIVKPVVLLKSYDSTAFLSRLMLGK